MDAEGADYADVLADAQAKGYAEADPSADVDGFDAASKTAILASIGFGTRVTTDDVYQQGIRTIGAEDIAQARELGYTIKLLGIARNTDAGVDVRVHPTLIPADHMLAKVNGAMNRPSTWWVTPWAKPCSTVPAQAPSPPQAPSWAISCRSPSRSAAAWLRFPRLSPMVTTSPLSPWTNSRPSTMCV